MKIKNIFLLFVILLVGCTPYNNNEVNRKLIQGKWSQVSLSSIDKDQSKLNEEIVMNNATLYFWGDSCIEQIKDISEEKKFKVKINNFIIGLEEEGVPINYLKIAKLTSDSLILHTNEKILKYSKEKDE